MSYGVIEDGVVTNVVEAPSDLAKGNGWIALPEGAGINWLYNGKTFSPPPTPPSLSEPPAITYKADVWRRATEAQAAIIDTELQKLDVRRRRMWDDSMYLDHSDELVAFFRTMLTQTFGATEANRILAPSNV